MTNPPTSGPLAGVRVVELAGIGPGPFAAMMLADLGADVIRVNRPGGGALQVAPADGDILARGRPSVVIDMKSPRGVELVLDLVERADILLEGFRPGVTERLGLGPDACLDRNPRLVYGRMTGWGQDGPLAQTAGHDINYISVAGALDRSATPISRRRSRRTCSVTSVAGRCISSPACSPPSPTPGRPARARSSTRRSPTASRT